MKTEFRSEFNTVLFEIIHLTCAMMIEPLVNTRVQSTVVFY